jgi:hypothetical protein
MPMPLGFKAHRDKSSGAGNASSIMIVIERRVSSD